MQASTRPHSSRKTCSINRAAPPADGPRPRPDAWPGSAPRSRSPRRDHRRRAGSSRRTPPWCRRTDQRKPARRSSGVCGATAAAGSSCAAAAPATPERDQRHFIVSGSVLRGSGVPRPIPPRHDPVLERLGSVHARPGVDNRHAVDHGGPPALVGTRFVSRHVQVRSGPSTLTVDSPRPARTPIRSAGSADGSLSRRLHVLSLTRLPVAPRSHRAVDLPTQSLLRRRIA